MPSVQTLYDNTPVKAKFDFGQGEIPPQAKVVIVGGGIAGASIAYHFAKAGWNDVCLLEQGKIASGTTWHSAGQVGQLRSSSAQTQVNKASAQLYSQLKAETGHDPGWLKCGGLQLASCQERMFQLDRNAAMADVFGVEAEVIAAERCADYWPMLRTDDLFGGVYLPGDGRVLPGECTVALAMGAATGGVSIIEDVEVESLVVEESKAGRQRIRGVRTNRGDIASEWVILATNMWMRQLGLQAGIDIPVYPCEHHYVITRPLAGVTRNSPCTRDPDAGLYFRALDDGSLKLGAFKKRSKPWQIEDRVPNDFSFALLEPDWPDFEEPFSAHCHRLQGLSRADVVRFVNGPEAFTPDNQFILGSPANTEGLFVCGGWNSAGIACAGGAGKYAVEWIEQGGMTIDLSSVDILRFQGFQNRRSYLHDRVSEVLGLHYQMAWPGREMETARGVRCSALYDIHASNNACFGQSSGWERPRFFAPKGIAPEIEYSFVRQNWQSWVAEEVRACREQVAILDQSTFAKFQIHGSDALELLQHLCCANVEVEPGRAVYTAMLNRGGTYESDLTVVRLAPGSFYVVTATAQQTKDYEWIRRNIAEGMNVELEDVTEAWNVVSVMGPQSGKVLNRIDDATFPSELSSYGTAREFVLNGILGVAIRISYVGEAGWELHVPRSMTVALYERLVTEGADFGIRSIGNDAISVMRIEKGFRAIGHELSTDESPIESGLAWVVDWDKPFVGRAALTARRRKGPSKRLACLATRDDSIVLWGGEPIRWNGQIAGYTSSACFSPTLGKSIAMGYLRKADHSVIERSDIRDGHFEIKQLGQWHSAEASWKPFV